MVKEIDTGNKYLVGVRGDVVVMLRPPRELTRSDAVLLAAYLVALADCIHDPLGDADTQFANVLEAVRA